MNETEVIKAAVGYADGWRLVCEDQVGLFEPEDWERDSRHELLISRPQQYDLAALAAQLVEQIAAMDGHLFESGGVGQALIWCSDDNMQSKIEMRGPNRTENTLRACVDFYGEVTEDK